MQFIQAEFSCIAGKDVAQLVSDASTRISEGSRSKQVVRFTDDSGRLTELINRIQDLSDKEQMFWVHYGKGFWSLLGMENFFWRRLQKKLARKRKYIHELSCIRLGVAEVTVEDLAGMPFRKMKEDERYELVQAARKADCAWFFLFDGNSLLADDLTLIAKDMG